MTLDDPGPITEAEAKANAEAHDAAESDEVPTDEAPLEGELNAPADELGLPGEHQDQQTG